METRHLPSASVLLSFRNFYGSSGQPYTAEDQVQSLVTELRSCKLHSSAKIDRKINVLKKKKDNSFLTRLFLASFGHQISKSPNRNY